MKMPIIYAQIITSIIIMTLQTTATIITIFFPMITIRIPMKMPMKMAMKMAMQMAMKITIKIAITIITISLALFTKIITILVKSHQMQITI